MMRQTCPYPYAGPGDKVTVDCEPTSFVNLTDQLSFSKTVENLAPYTEYEFYVIPVNGHPNQYTSHNVSVVITAKTGKNKTYENIFTVQIMVAIVL